MGNNLLRGITKDKKIRFFCVDSTNVVKEAKRIHNLSLTNSIIMGKLLSATLMMAMDMKSYSDGLTLKLDCTGNAGNMLVTAHNDGTVKCFPHNPSAEPIVDKNTKHVDFNKFIGDGTITIIKDLGLKNPYVGTTELSHKDIASDLTYYFANSEQIPSSVGLGVLLDEQGKIRQSGGFIVQLMPNTPERVIAKLEDNLRKFPNFTDVLDMGYSPKEICENFILKGLEPRITSEIPAVYKCDCSKEKFRKGLALLPIAEIEEIINTEKKAVIECHFCNSTYEYDEKELQEVLEKLKRWD